MSYTMVVHPAYWRAVFSGSFINDDFRNLITKIRKIRDDSPLVPPNGIIDMRELSTIDLDFGAVMAVANARQNGSNGKEMRIAIVADAPIQYGYARMFLTLLNHRQVNIRVFLDDEQGVFQWILN